MTAIKSDYGTTYPGTVNSQLWRTDRYVSDEDGSEHFNLTKVAHRGDLSRPVSVYTGRDKYSAKCACCYLNQPHSVEYHNASVAR